ncbi:LemA family protein [Myceligenerans pegani]|uniref:LemA family protein n=1 Tax=Myceligenerans pegani TaxID=2776917 RepID=A0ABR9MUU6_9MICO|nr:LemA family protein [Myceligenerans sp. TRM 65318]MBE1874900.1 LemA family protein [Myceligenerans sp. TRM 65318]MBE3017171.1 LemA family protein [Myceligenerans sp. TRM 65318]
MDIGTIIVLAIVIVVVIVLALWVAGIYNGLVRARNAYKNAWAQVDVQVKRRHDLIPNIVQLAKGSLVHERSTLEAVIQARSQAVNAQSAASAAPGDPAAMQALAEGENMLTQAMGRFIALTESYPDLKANQALLQAMEDLRSTENKVAFARQAYNDGVMFYNNKREVFPASLLAGPFGFAEAALFEIEDPAQREAPQVDLDLPDYPA